MANEKTSAVLVRVPTRLHFAAKGVAGTRGVKIGVVYSEALAQWFNSLKRSVKTLAEIPGSGYEIVKIAIPGLLHALAKSEAALERVELREFYSLALQSYIGVAARKRGVKP
jgi:hypothetical protein